MRKDQSRSNCISTVAAPTATAFCDKQQGCPRLRLVRSISGAAGHLGGLHTGFSFENPDNPVGRDLDLLLPALTAANLAGPLAKPGREDREEQIVQAITGFLSLPELELP
ncbi:hypothetical protein [Streptomyces sp. NPDC001530]|uniref:hypothetical protein n=1 Tax=Streptomyces sp. NPDC001530 TaxID=3364582 RepID=UPI003699D58C